ncbi:IclR family transcriptional regulator [Terracoccus luteus]|uniref:Glycerol operon regulatory protein n=1 Tax=Terracoccus luteus TaxID=53356 RepID=A0A839Q143_9MICO|nr:IclR family transcriptional regulator [Terracoccus luteus]MBB2988005.1 DNA-binding IclR family transcriptional regulator [Terracoccus luteus]MCP2173656.1 DNA-binding IclR family transcriptional regulator [Terracoccus luteus]
MANAPAAASALDVLEHLSRHAEPLPAAAVARDLGLPRSSVYHLLSVLVSRGYVTHYADDRRYGLGQAAYELGSAYQRQAPLARLARSAVRRLVDRSARNAHLATLDGRDVIYLLEERAPGQPTLVTDVGVRLPAHLTASGLALLAALPAAQVRALYPDRASFTRRHEAGPRSLTELRSLLARTRAEGFAREDDTVTPGLSSVAVAVTDRSRRPVAAIAVTVRAQDATAEHLLCLVDAVRAAADEIARRVSPPRSDPSRPRRP